MAKLVLVIASIAVPIVITALMIPIFLGSASNLQELNQQKEDTKQFFVSQLQNEIGNCTAATGIVLNDCKQMIESLQSQCGLYGNPSICSDSRINDIMASNAQTVIVPPSTSFATLTNNQIGFSIGYPSNWVVDNNMPDGGIGLKDKMPAPDLLVEIKQMQDNGTFDSIVASYVNQVGVPGYPTTVESQDKVTVGGKEAYRVSYTETMGNTTCQNEDYIVNDGRFFPVISFDNCDPSLFSQFLPTYEKMVYTFRDVQAT